MKIARIGLCVLLLTVSAWAQFTLVTGTVTDPNGVPYALGTIAPLLITSATPTFTATGQLYFPPSQASGLDSTGHFLVRLADNTTLTPGGTTWNFKVCSAVGTVPLSFGTGPQCFTLAAPITISGASQDIGAALRAVAPTLTLNFGTSSACSGAATNNGVLFLNGSGTCVNSANFTYTDATPTVRVGTQSSTAGFFAMSGAFSAFSQTLLGPAVKYFNFSNITPQGNVLGIGGTQPTMTVGQANGIDPCTNSSLVRSSNVVTATTDGTCAFLDVDNANVHSYVTIAGADAGFNGTFQILSVNTSTNVITYAQTAGNATAVTAGYSMFGSFNSNLVATTGQANLDSLSMVIYADTSSDGFLNAQGMRLVVGNAVGTVNARNGGPITLKAGDGNLGNNTNGGAIVLQPGSNAGGTGSNGYVLLGSPVAFASLPPCSATLEGAARPVNDSTTATYNATVTGSGANHILAYCNGTNWTAH
jgi:hypothetical protein